MSAMKGTGHDARTAVTLVVGTLIPQVHQWVDERAATGINATDDVPAR